MSKKTIAYVSMTLALVLSVVVVGGPVFLFPEYPWMPFAVFFGGILIHCAQLKPALEAGKEKGVSNARVVIMTVLFGATYWKPLKEGFIEK